MCHSYSKPKVGRFWDTVYNAHINILNITGLCNYFSERSNIKIDRYELAIKQENNERAIVTEK